MSEPLKDANTEVDSSTTSEVAAEQQHDASAESSTAKPADKPEKTLADIANELAAKAAKESDVQESNNTEQAESSTEGKAEEATEPDDKATADEPPFHEHPRWKEVVSQRDELKARLDKYEPAVKQFDAIQSYRQQYGVSDEQFAQALETAALLNTNPALAAERLKPIFDSLGFGQSNELPDDLKQKVENGIIDADTAKEIVLLRAQGKQRELGEKTRLANEARQRQAAVTETLNSWDESHRKSDPDFQPKTDGLPDGKYEFVRDRFLILSQQRPPRSPNEAVALVEQAYKDVSASLGRFVPKPSEKKALSSTRASVTAVEEPKNLYDIAKQIAARHRR